MLLSKSEGRTFARPSIPAGAASYLLRRSDVAAAAVAAAERGRACVVGPGIGIPHHAAHGVSQLQILDLIPQGLDLVGLNQAAGCLALCVDGADDIAGVFLRIVAYAVNVPVGLTATLLGGELGFSDGRGDPGKPVQHGGVLGVEPIAQAVCDAVQLASHLCGVKSLLHLGFGEGVVVPGKPVSTNAKQEQKQDDNLHPASAKLVPVADCLEISGGHHVHAVHIFTPFIFL